MHTSITNRRHGSYSFEGVTAKISTIILFVVTLVLTVGISEAQEAKPEQPYTIERQEQEVSQGATLITETYRYRDGGACLQRTSTVTNTGKEVAKSVNYSLLRIIKELARNADENDRTRLLFDRGISAFGWYGEKDKSMFDTIYAAAAVKSLRPGGKVYETKNLLVHNKSDDYSLLDQAGLDMVKEKGIIATIENRIGQQLAKKKGILVSQKPYFRDEEGSDKLHLRCHESLVELGPDEQEKRYTFFGDQAGSSYKILEWTVNNKSKLSWIDCETGIGSFMFQDSDEDGVFETLELVIDNKRNVEIFDVSDPWNIRLVSLDSELFEDANASKNRANVLGKAMNELEAQGLLERSDDGILQVPDSVSGSD